MSRRSAREEAMKLIYQKIMNKTGSKEILEGFYENLENEISEEERNYINECVSGAEENEARLDAYIEENSKGWKINRISKVDLAIMRLALYEILYREDIPTAVAVNEAIELGKKFSGEKSSTFINGVLGNIIRVMEKNV